MRFLSFIMKLKIKIVLFRKGLTLFKITVKIKTKVTPMLTPFKWFLNQINKR